MRLGVVVSNAQIPIYGLANRSFPKREDNDRGVDFEP